MTTPKNAAKGKVAATRRPRMTKAEVARREAALKSRETYSAFTNQELSGSVRNLAIGMPGIAEHELLLIAADRLTNSYASPPQFIGGAPMRPFTYGPVGAGTPSQIGPIVFNSPTIDDGGRGPDGLLPSEDHPKGTA